MNRAKFLKAIFPDGLGYLHLLATGPGGPHDARFGVKFSTAIESFVTNRPALNIYFGVAARRLPDNGKLENCTTLAVLFAEIDFKDFSGGEAEARAKLAAFPIQPHIVVFSGGGLHCYWLLTEPMDLCGDGAALAGRRLRALARAVGADLAAAEPARVLRLPGTKNFKYDPPRDVVVERFDVTQRCAVVDLDAAIDLAREPEVRHLIQRDRTPIVHGVDDDTRVKKARTYLASQPAAVQGKQGDSRTYQVCCTVAVGYDLNADQAVEVLQDWNARCTPPWTEDQLRQKIRNANRYAKGVRGELLRTGDFKLYATGTRAGQIVADDQGNVRLALERLGLSFRFDEFAAQPLVSYKGAERQLDDAVMDTAWLQIDEQFGFRAPFDFFQKVVGDLARRHLHHPVKAYLTSLRWDGEKRLDGWLSIYGGAEDTPYTRAVGALFLTAAVRRIQTPGSKFDELLVVETNIQGKNKSQAFRTMCANEDWFSDDLPLGVESKQVIERTRGKWIIEASELQGYSTKEVDGLKSFLSRQVDGPVRMAYGRLPIEVMRQFVMGGSTNQITEYLRDSTGNRRFWPVRIDGFDIDLLKRDRDQLWAEAVVREASGASIRLPQELWAAAGVQQEARRQVDPWEEMLDDTIDFECEAILVEDLWLALGDAAKSRRNNDAERLSRILQRRGFDRKKKLDVEYLRDGLLQQGKRQWAWIRSETAPTKIIKQGCADAGQGRDR